MIDPKLNDAFLKSIKHYFDSQTHENYDQAHGGDRKFTKDYFDNLDNELNNPVPEDKKMIKGKSVPKIKGKK